MVAWTAHRPGSPDIIGVRIWEGSGAVKKFNTGGWVLDTDGKYVLWMEPTNAGYDIVAYDVDSDQIKTRIPLPASAWMMVSRVSGGRVAFFDQNNNMAVRDIANGDTAVLTSGGASGLIGPSITDSFLMWYTTTGEIHVARRESSGTTTTTSTTTTASTTTTTASTTTTTRLDHHDNQLPGGVGFTDVRPGISLP